MVQSFFCREVTRKSTLLLLLAAGVGALTGCAGQKPAVDGQVLQEPQSTRKWEANGIRVERVTLAMGGVMLDMRYRITDLEKAQQVLTREAQLSLIDQSSGAVLPVPNMAKVGKLRQLPNQETQGRQFWVFFSNPGMLVKPGSRVTLKIGDLRIGNIVVE